MYKKKRADEGCKYTERKRDRKNADRIESAKK